MQEKQVEWANIPTCFEDMHHGVLSSVENFGILKFWDKNNLLKNTKPQLTGKEDKTTLTIFLVAGNKKR